MKAIFYDSDCISCFLIINHAELFKKDYIDFNCKKYYENLIQSE